MKKYFFALIAAAAFVSPAAAGGSWINVPENHSWMNGFVSWTRGCTYPPPAKVTISAQPLHGVIRMDEGDWTVHSKDICDGHVMHATRMTYIPQRGYTGPDSVSFEVDYYTDIRITSMTRAYHNTYNFNVVPAPSAQQPGKVAKHLRKAP